MTTKKILVIGNGYIADNFIFYIKDIHNITVYARAKNVEYHNVTYIYNAVENINSIKNIYDNIFILFGHSRPNNVSELHEVIYSNVFLLSKILDFAHKNNSNIFYPATSLSLSNSTKKLTYYSYSHVIAIDLIKVSKLKYTICYLHNIYGSLTNNPKKNKMVIDHFIDSYNNKQPINLINNGIQKRIFTHILDVVVYMEHSLNNNLNEVNLVKNNKMYSVKEIAELFGLEMIPIQNTMYSTENPNLSSINDINGWNETIDIKQWIKHTIL
jgi:nucleoside-diphosphate-sugar epimerase